MLKILIAAMALSIAVFSYVRFCSLVDVYQRLRRNRFYPEEKGSRDLKRRYQSIELQAIRSQETSSGLSNIANKLKHRKAHKQCEAVLNYLHRKHKATGAIKLQENPSKIET
jgi:hypothetical protein